ncbi:jasmonoyl--L-amino acid synthetase JAR6-like [Andrographis paniculata]|uniref:jasmonoyl--L-amino acid synthetase JAR6-like n=1 Tax=Andrographis paniculata TaxID=175694 RepID=UPI0021E79417|nr:jasmonoyl--L-amino acid synthetase JAR6-like [Andrographis paniculata]XP_051148259.1 jasmonoyl--L-amino acid synthetase JAR6-like [Andrographis paniculata]
MLEKMKMEEEFDPEVIIEEFEALSKDAERVQKETLKKILTENGESEYLLVRCGLGRRTDPENFKACVPLVTHADLDPYIQRIADSTEPICVLTGKPITTISLSSGTTGGKPKFVPFNDGLMEITVLMYKTSFAYRNREYPIEEGKALQFIYSSMQFKTAGGLAAGTSTTNVYRHPLFKPTMQALHAPCCSPDAVIFGPDFRQSSYCHLLLALVSRCQIQLIASTFAFTIVHAFRSFEIDWQNLVADIRHGRLPAARITAPGIRAAVSELLGPNPELADEIHRACAAAASRNWYGIIPAVFPNAKYVYAIMTGSMEPYIGKLRQYAGDLPLVAGDYGASEGWIGANIRPKRPPESVTFVVRPDIGYFEFIPMNDEEESSCPVGLTEVEIGREYEVVITNVAGLYRYKLGDIVKIKGFHNSTPELEFVCRKNVVLTINMDKNTEKDLQIATEEAARVLTAEKYEVVDFTSRVDFSTEPAHYVIFWEVSGDPAEELLQECCNCLDMAFKDAGYVSSRKVNTIGALELKVMKKGTFQKIMDHYIGLGAVVSQFKTPRCVGADNTAVLGILCGNAVKTFFSTAF